MTVIAAMDCGDYLLMGADSLVTEDAGLRVKHKKLSVLHEVPVAFGFSGDAGVGFQFRDWMLAQPWSSAVTWPEFIATAGHELNRLNGRRREMAQLARVELKDDDLASALVAGSLGGVLDIWDLDSTGGASSVKHRGLPSIGSGYPHAYIAYVTLIDYVKASRDVGTMAVVMEIAARFAPKCEPPCRLLRLTPTEVTELRSMPGGGAWVDGPVEQ